MSSNTRAGLIALASGVGLVAAIAVGGGHHGAVSQRPSRSGTPDVEVKPIDIPVVACPYLRVVRVTVNDAGAGWADAMNASPKRWSHFAKQLAPKLARFEVALRVAIPHVPRPVRGDLRIALGQVRIGRVPLAASRDFDDYTAKTHWAVLDGPSAMMEASGLVGHACGGLRVADFS